MKVLLLSHQLDYSGAPIALLNLAGVLRELGADVLLASLRPGPMQAGFREIGVRPFDGATTGLDLIVANTILTMPLSQRLAAGRIPVVAWVHESIEFFRYLSGRPEDLLKGRYAAVLFPSRFQIEQFSPYLTGMPLSEFPNMVAATLGVVEGRGGYLAVSGGWEPRKDQSRLVELLSAVGNRRPVLFVGATARPGLEPPAYRFTGRVAPAESQRLIASSDAYLSAAAFETQNLAAVEAAMSGVPVLVSDIPAHRQLKAWIPSIRLFDKADPSAFRAALEEITAPAFREHHAQAQIEAARKIFGREAFTARVRALLTLLERDRVLTDAAAKLARLGMRPTRMVEPARLEAFLGRVKPVLSPKPLVRLGGPADGGYLIPDDLDDVRACFSPGVSDVADFEADLASRGIDCFLADASVDGPPVENPRFRFEKKFLGAECHGHFMTLPEWVGRCAPADGDLLLQMDIEGAEYEVLYESPLETLRRFRIVVVEFHGLDALFERNGFDLIRLTFERLLRLFRVVHIHPNNCVPTVRFDRFAIPPVMEFTFLRRDRFGAVPPRSVTAFPHPLDRPNVEARPDILLPGCWFEAPRP